MDTALIIHPGYSTISVGLTQHGNLIATGSVHKHLACRDLIPLIDELLITNKLSITDLAYGAAYQGPGPFTTLRTGLATINGLAFAHHLPLVAIDGLQAFITELTSHKTNYIIILLNAFAGDVYYAIYNTHTDHFETGCTTFEQFITRLTTLLDKPTLTATIVGNGTTLHASTFAAYAKKEQLVLPVDAPEEVSMITLAKVAYITWMNGVYSSQILPLYLKDSSTPLGKTIA